MPNHSRDAFGESGSYGGEGQLLARSVSKAHSGSCTKPKFKQLGMSLPMHRPLSY
jgi:hypothetical protein